MLARLKTLHTGLLLAGGLLLAQGALALGLGEITLSSRLNEPLNASIELLDIEGLDEEQILVSLAAEEDFARVNVERSAFLTSVQFDVELAGNTGRILLTTTANVTAPFLNLIVNTRWPNGRLLREYTLLVDLPEFSAAPASQPALATTTPVTPNVAPAPASTAPAPAATTADGTFTVAPGDTVWEIAAAMRPDQSVSVQQMMVAIVRANPDAFVDGNINRIRSGRVLRMPASDEISLIDQAAAIAEISRQNLAPGGQPLAVNDAAGAGAGRPVQDELSVLTDDRVAPAGAGSTDLEATIAALENDLMLSEESLDRARIENLELNNRISSLEEQIDLLESIIAMEDARIARLQEELAAQSAATAAAFAEAQTAATALADLDNAPAPQAGLLGRLNGMLQNGVILIGVVLALVLGVLGILVVKRRRDEAEAEEHEFNPVLVAPAVAFAGDSGDEPEKTGLLAGLMARFRRSEEADEDDFEPEDLDAAVQASDRVSNVPRAEAGIAYAPPKDVREDTDKMLNDMGISDELLSLDDALSGIDAETADAPPAADLSNVAAAEAVPAADLAESAARAEHSAEEAEQDVAEQEVAEEAHQEEVAEEIAEESTGERAADRAAEAAPILDEAPPPAPADVTSAALPDEIAFTPGEIPAPTPAAAVVTEPVEPETFEFKLRDEVAQTSSAPAVVEPAPEQVETFDFRLDAMPVNEDAAAAALAESDAGLPESVALEIDPDADLAELSFDDTMLSDEDDAESPYKSRSGMDECDTKLDLATAYEAMGDVDDAIEILNEVIAEGNPGQVELAQRLKQSWQSA